MGTGAGLGGLLGASGSPQDGMGSGLRGVRSLSLSFSVPGGKSPGAARGREGCSAPVGPSRVPAGEGTGRGGGWGGREAASSELPLTRVSLVPAEWVWPGLTSRSSRPPT